MRLRARAFIVSEEYQLQSVGDHVQEQTAMNVFTNDEVTEEKRSLLRWKNHLWFQQRRKEQTGDVLPSQIAHLDPERTICFVSIDAGMVSLVFVHFVDKACM